MAFTWTPSVLRYDHFDTESWSHTYTVVGGFMPDMVTPVTITDISIIPHGQRTDSIKYSVLGSTFTFSALDTCLGTFTPSITYKNNNLLLESNDIKTLPVNSKLVSYKPENTAYKDFQFKVTVAGSDSSFELKFITFRIYSNYNTGRDAVRNFVNASGN